MWPNGASSASSWRSVQSAGRVERVLGVDLVGILWRVEGRLRICLRLFFLVPKPVGIGL